MIHNITWLNLAWCLAPFALALLIFKFLNIEYKELLLAGSRMLLQLILVGFALVLLFDLDSPIYILMIFLAMCCFASWIAIRPVKEFPGLFTPAIIGLFIAVSIHLALSLLGVMQVEQWWEPRVLIPLAGMYLANTMNGISLAAERYYSELSNLKTNTKAQNMAFKSAMIPQINGLLAVGLVSLPGMMTGQILSGVSPLIAVRYQIMIMSMILGCSVVGVSIFLYLINKSNLKTQIQ